MLGTLRFRFLNFWTISTLFLLVFFLFSLVYPLGTLFLNSFRTPDADFSMQNYVQFFSRPYYYQSLINSLDIGIVSTTVATVVGVTLAYIMHRYNIVFKGALRILFVVALLSPPFIGAYSWILLLGRNGLLTGLLESIGFVVPTIYGRNGIILVFSLGSSCFVFRYVTAALRGIDSSLEEAAESLGASRLRRTFTISLPVIFPAITSVMVIVFMRSIADFGTPLLIGEGFRTMPILIYNAYLSEMGGDARMAGAVSVIAVSLSLGVLVAQKAYIARRNYNMSALRPPEEVKLRGLKRILVSIPCLFWVLLALTPQITVFITSFIRTRGPVFTGELTLDNYGAAFRNVGRSIINSYLYATVALVFIIVFGIITAYISVRRRRQGGTLLDSLVMFPFVIPGAVIGICYIIAFNTRPFLLTGTAAIIILAYIVRRLPHTVRSSVGVLEAIDPALEEASISLGVPPMKTFFVITARLIIAGVAAGALLSWISCMNELSSTILLYSSGTMTMPIAVYTYVSRGNFGISAALGTIMSATIVLVLIVIARLTRKTGGII